MRQKQPGHYHHGALDAALIDTAIELTTELGIEAWGLAEAARRLGVSSGAPYKHFKNKSELLDAVAVHGLDAVRSSIAGALASSHDPKAQLVAVARGHVLLACRKPTLYQLTFAGVRSDTLKQLAAAAPESAFGVLRAAVIGWQAAGLLRPGDPLITAVMIWAHSHGLASLVATGRLAMSERKALAFAEEHMLALLGGLAPND